MQDYPGIETRTPPEFVPRPGGYDIAISASSFDHDGLGRCASGRRRRKGKGQQTGGRVRLLRSLALARFIAGYQSPLPLSPLSDISRYGDPLDANADIKAMRLSRCLVRPGGRLLLTIPVGPDVVAYNLHRRWA